MRLERSNKMLQNQYCLKNTIRRGIPGFYRWNLSQAFILGWDFVELDLGALLEIG